MSDTINIIKDKIDNEVGVWYYASSLLKEYNIETFETGFESIKASSLSNSILNSMP